MPGVKVQRIVHMHLACVYCTSGNAERRTESRKGLVRVYAPTFPRLYHQTVSLGISIREDHSLEGSAQ
jgi:hypothetical protein